MTRVEERNLFVLRDRHEIVDALYRFGAGQDLRDRELFLSAFAPDAQLDFTQPARRFGTDIPVMPDRAAIAGILGTLAPVDTTHTVTNCRMVVDGDDAHMFALVEAQHVTRAAPQRHLLLKNIYDVDLTRDRDRWLIQRMAIRNIWSDGDPAVLFREEVVDDHGTDTSASSSAAPRANAPQSGTADDRAPDVAAVTQVVAMLEHAQQHELVERVRRPVPARRDLDDRGRPAACRA